MKMKQRLKLTLLCTFLPCILFAKSYPFSINLESKITVCRSTEPGKKLVQVTAIGKNVERAIDKAMLDAVVALSFYGASGTEEGAGCPAILIDGKECYNSNKKLFDVFFKKGSFFPFVKKVNSSYPMGDDNVSVSKGRRVRILLIVETKKLSEYYEEKGLKTIISELSTF